MKLSPTDFLKHFDSLKSALAALRDLASEEYGSIVVSEKLRESVPAEELFRMSFELLNAALVPSRKVFPFRTPEASMKDDPEWPLVANQPDHLVFKGDWTRDLSVGNIPLKKAVLPIMAEISALILALRTARSHADWRVAGPSRSHSGRNRISGGVLLFSDRFERSLEELFPEEARRIASRVDRTRLISIGRSLLQRTDSDSHLTGLSGKIRTVSDLLRKHDESSRRHNRFFYSKRKQQR